MLRLRRAAPAIRIRAVPGVAILDEERFLDSGNFFATFLERGEIAELKLAPPAAYLSEPIKVKSRGGGGLWKEIRTGAKLPPKAAP